MRDTRAQIRSRHPLLTPPKHSTPDTQTGSDRDIRQFLDGRRTWVPDDTSGQASQNLRAILEHLICSLDAVLLVEIGPRPETNLHLLTGRVLEVNDDALRFSPAGGHQPIAIPFHRLVSMTANNDAWVDYRNHFDAGSDPGWSARPTSH
ncbi:hypothetical protein [Actinomadura geliboluensis]|uniref:Uncharacterized protein n=1 Tax=Actinomadura geliboluensis TaxID=882440 RepID=A0A5S4H4T6_9ACTN|nr:hypothetical protein [Actinomadura geliboluensis]TMR40238.1 hypothetical protein ETD96_11690 [Actinomadura geliboluensis]